MFFGIVPMFVAKDFVQNCFGAQIEIRAKMCMRTGIQGESFPLYHPVAFYRMRARFQNNLSLTLCLRVRAKVL